MTLPDHAEYVRVVQRDSNFVPQNSQSQGENSNNDSSCKEKSAAFVPRFVEPGRTWRWRGVAHHVPHMEETDIIYSRDIVPDLKGGKCNRFLRTPVQVPSCGHKFCRKCILKVVPDLKGRVTGVCPKCKVKFDKRMIGPIHGYDSVIELVRSQQWCKNALCYDWTTERYLKDSEACTFVGRTHELHEHEKTCAFKAVECSRGCGSLLWRKDVVAHADICKLKCPQWPCTMLVLAKLMEHHKKEECIATVLSCPMAKAGCPVKALRRDMQTHVGKCVFAMKAEIKRLKREKAAAMAKRDKWKRVAMKRKQMFEHLFERRRLKRRKII